MKTIILIFGLISIASCSKKYTCCHEITTTYFDEPEKTNTTENCTKFKGTKEQKANNEAAATDYYEDLTFSVTQTMTCD